MVVFGGKFVAFGCILPVLVEPLMVLTLSDTYRCTGLLTDRQLQRIFYMFRFDLILGSSDIHIMVIGPIIHLQLSMGSEIRFAAGVLKSGETTQDQAGIVVDSPGACTGRHCLPFHKGGSQQVSAN